MLKALTYAPTGAIVAAPTTSLPEEVGGHRNWDYRYCWLRDAALNLYALFTLGYTEEAHAFMAWIERTTAGRAEDLQIMYGIGGERYLPERNLAPLDGLPRIDAGAHRQRRGRAIPARRLRISPRHRLAVPPRGRRHLDLLLGFLCGVVDVVAERWMLPDEGIWEVRGGRRHFVSSKILAWVAVDRAIRLAQARHLPGDIDAWKALRREIRSTIDARGVDPGTGAFVQAFDDTGLDASNLLAALVRFVPRRRSPGRGDDRGDGRGARTERPRLPLPGRATGCPVARGNVRDLQLLARRQPGTRRRRRRDACELFERLIGCSNDVGLLAEEIDPRTGELLGNFPQAFSHVGLIGAAINLQRAAAHRGGQRVRATS